MSKAFETFSFFFFTCSVSGGSSRSAGGQTTNNDEFPGRIRVREFERAAFGVEIHQRTDVGHGGDLVFGDGNRHRAVQPVSRRIGLGHPGKFLDTVRDVRHIHAEQVHARSQSRLENHGAIGGFFAAGNEYPIQFEQAERRHRHDAFPGQRGVSEGEHQKCRDEKSPEIPRTLRVFRRVFQLPIFSHQNVRRALRSHRKWPFMRRNSSVRVPTRRPATFLPSNHRSRCRRPGRFSARGCAKSVRAWC